MYYHGCSCKNYYIFGKDVCLMAKNLMIQGTMSNAGKSIVTAGVLRVLKQDGYRVAPFKSQNMALNSNITKDGFEMGRAQVMQAEAAGTEPDVSLPSRPYGPAPLPEYRDFPLS